MMRLMAFNVLILREVHFITFSLRSIISVRLYDQSEQLIRSNTLTARNVRLSNLLIVYV